MFELIRGRMAQQRGFVTFRQATGAGLRPADLDRLIRHERLRVMRRAVYLDTERWDAAEPFVERPLLQVLAAEFVLTMPHHFSHDSAALLLGIPLLDGPGALVHVTRRRVTGDRCKHGIKHHRAPFPRTRAPRPTACPCSARSGPRSTSPGSTACFKASPRATTCSTGASLAGA